MMPGDSRVGFPGIKFTDERGYGHGGGTFKSRWVTGWYRMDDYGLESEGNGGPRPFDGEFEMEDAGVVWLRLRG